MDPRCPVCQTPLDLFLKPIKRVKEGVVFDVEVRKRGANIIEVSITDAFHRYLLWRALGKPEYGKDQDFYDPSNDTIEIKKENGKTWVSFLIYLFNTSKGEVRAAGRILLNRH